MLREPEARDRAAFIELLASPEAHTYLGGPRPRDELEREMPGAAPEQCPGKFVVDLGYPFLPGAWGFGYAAEACAAALDWFEGVLPGEPVVLTTQTANVGSMRLAAKLGFTEVERFQAWDAEQWLGLRSPVTPSA